MMPDLHYKKIVGGAIPIVAFSILFSMQKPNPTPNLQPNHSCAANRNNPHSDSIAQKTSIREFGSLYPNWWQDSSLKKVYAKWYATKQSVSGNTLEEDNSNSLITHRQACDGSVCLPEDTLIARGVTKQTIILNRAYSDLNSPASFRASLRIRALFEEYGDTIPEAWYILGLEGLKQLSINKISNIQYRKNLCAGAMAAFERAIKYDKHLTFPSLYEKICKNPQDPGPTFGR